MAGVDDLFSGEPAPAAPADRLRGVGRLLVVGGVLDLLGPFCLTGVPGAAVTLWAWYQADEEVARAEEGVLSPEAGRRARQLRSVAFGLLVFTAFSLLTQLALFGLGVYDAILAGILGLLGVV